MPCCDSGTAWKRNPHEPHDPFHPAPRHGAGACRHAARAAAARAHRAGPGRRLVRSPEAPPGRPRRTRASRRRTAAASRDATARVLRRHAGAFRSAAGSARHDLPAQRLAGAAADRRRHDAQLCGPGRRARLGERSARGRQRDRPQPGAGHRAVPPRDRPRRLDDRLCRRHRPQARAARPGSAETMSATLHAPARAGAQPRDIAELCALAAIWGASFLFMRVAVPSFGAVALAGVRVIGASLVLLPLLAVRGGLPAMRAHWRPILLVGVTNSALPFMGFSYAALSINAGLGSIFNAATPLFGAAIGWLWLRERPTGWRALGLGIGFAGVIGLAVERAAVHDGADRTSVLLAILACLHATASYGYSANYTKRWLTGV